MAEINPLTLALINAGAQIAQSGALSPVPQSPIVGLTRGVASGFNAFQQAQQSNFRNQLLRAQLDQMQAEIQLKRNRARIRENISNRLSQLLNGSSQLSPGRDCRMSGGQPIDTPLTNIAD